ncbi:MAG: hypothetical protein ACRECU_07165 [Methylocella sp.]
MNPDTLLRGAHAIEGYGAGGFLYSILLGDRRRAAAGMDRCADHPHF